MFYRSVRWTQTISSIYLEGSSAAGIRDIDRWMAHPWLSRDNCRSTSQQHGSTIIHWTTHDAATHTHRQTDGQIDAPTNSVTTAQRVTWANLRKVSAVRIVDLSADRIGSRRRHATGNLRPQTSGGGACRNFHFGGIYIPGGLETEVPIHWGPGAKPGRGSSVNPGKNLRRPLPSSHFPSPPLPPFPPLFSCFPLHFPSSPLEVSTLKYS